MYTRILIPLDGSKVAEGVLPYARSLARALKLPVELVGVVDLAGLASRVGSGSARHFEYLIESGVRESKEYLREIARTFPYAEVACCVEKGRPEEIIIEKAAHDKGTLIAMATHGRSDVNRWLMGSVAEKVLRATVNPLLLVRGDEEGQSDGETALESIVVPLDGSKLAESVLPGVIELAKKLNLEVILTRAYALPIGTYAAADDYYIPNCDELKAMVKEEVSAYLDAKVREIREKGIEKVSAVLMEGPAAETIIDLARKTPNNFVAMCTHGRSGVKRWVLGSVTEKVVRHSGDPVLVISAKAEAREAERSFFPELIPEIHNALRYTLD